jgi:hypothetical protein
MGQQRYNEADAEDLARMREEVDGWRRTRGKLGPMPAPLWKGAAALAGRLGVNPVKNVLGLNFNALREHLEAATDLAAGVGAAPARFVEFKGAQLLGAKASTGPVVTFADARGTRLTVRLAVGTELDVARLVEAFRR